MKLSHPILPLKEFFYMILTVGVLACLHAGIIYSSGKPQMVAKMDCGVFIVNDAKSNTPDAKKSKVVCSDGTSQEDLTSVLTTDELLKVANMIGQNKEPIITKTVNRRYKYGNDFDIIFELKNPT